jgi:hypothetical protein
MSEMSDLLLECPPQVTLNKLQQQALQVTAFHFRVNDLLIFHFSVIVASVAMAFACDVVFGSKITAKSFCAKSAIESHTAAAAVAWRILRRIGKCALFFSAAPVRLN